MVPKVWRSLGDPGGNIWNSGPSTVITRREDPANGAFITFNWTTLITNAPISHKVLMFRVFKIEEMVEADPTTL